MKIIIGAFLGWLLGKLEKNKSFKTKNDILIGIIGVWIGTILSSIFFSSKMELSNTITTTKVIIVYCIIYSIAILFFYLATKIKNTKLKTLLDSYLFKISPFIGIISIVNAYFQFSSANLVNASTGIVLFLILIVLFAVFVFWGIIKFFNNNNYFKNKYLFLLLYSVPILIFLSDTLKSR